ncbi:hypothetical protein N657DRAFT_440432 [Parathielavia appendiculata]|uniref:Uncharacterized protein n=1 Tax=Parathielavia appendiculata TaxID=2587402 RepID=A0AAN6Z3W4_9PEZI|nr:hypothetical protein N657DRAFT_440432 [Parathielavia appendiculata]
MAATVGSTEDRSQGEEVQEKKKTSRKKGTESRKGRKAKKDLVRVEQIRNPAGDFLKAGDKEPWNIIPHGAKSRAALDLVRSGKKWHLTQIIGRAPFSQLPLSTDADHATSFRLVDPGSLHSRVHAFQSGFKFV